MMLHQAIYWPEYYDIKLWSFAWDYAVYLWNHLPDRNSDLAPIEIWTGAKLDPKHLRNAHTWGCPCYVLEPKAQDGKLLPKLQPCLRRGMFLGFSDAHSTTVGLIRNLRTEYISPQFHVVYDDEEEKSKKKFSCSFFWYIF